MNKFAAMGWYKHAEIDDWQNGCLPESRTMFEGRHDTFSAATIEELIEQCAKFVDQLDLTNCRLDSCDEAGWLDVQVHETDEGVAASDEELKERKEGKKRIWLATYTFQILRAEKIVLSRNVSDLKLYAAA